MPAPKIKLPDPTLPDPAPSRAVPWLLMALERLIFFGFISRLTFTLTERLHLPAEQAFAYYGQVMFALYALRIPLALVSDRWLGSRAAVAVGFGLQAAGLLAASLFTPAALTLGVLLFTCGSAATYPNMVALLGLRYAPDSRRLGGALVGLMVALEIGAGLGPLLTELVTVLGGDDRVLAALASLAALALALLAWKWRPLAPYHSPKADPATPAPAPGDRLSPRRVVAASVLTCYLLSLLRTYIERRLTAPPPLLLLGLNLSPQHPALPYNVLAALPALVLAIVVLRLLRRVPAQPAIWIRLASSAALLLPITLAAASYTTAPNQDAARFLFTAATLASTLFGLLLTPLLAEQALRHARRYPVTAVALLALLLQALQGLLGKLP